MKISIRYKILTLSRHVEKYKNRLAPSLTEIAKMGINTLWKVDSGIYGDDSDDVEAGMEHCMKNTIRNHNVWFGINTTEDNVQISQIDTNFIRFFKSLKRVKRRSPENNNQSTYSFSEVA